jgi:hypothetical protein
VACTRRACTRRWRDLVKYKGRSDKNYIILEGITSTSTIFPLAFGFCFGESERTYNQFWDDVLGYSDTLKSAIDNVNTRINADRHQGIRNSCDKKLQHGAKILHNDPVHLKRNVRTALQAAGCPFASELLYTLRGSLPEILP